MKKPLALGIWISAFVPVFASANEIVAPTADLPPLGIYGKNNDASGVAVDMVREISRRTNIPIRFALVPVARLTTVAAEGVSVIPILTRTPERLSKFRWIGEVVEDKYCFVTLKSKKAISTAQEAKAAGSIGVNSGGAMESMLRKIGVTAVSTADGATGNIRKLNAGVTDAWFSTKGAAFYSYKHDGFDPANIVCSGDFGHISFWIAASLAMPEEQFKQMQTAFAAMQKDGTAKAIIAKYE